MTTSGTGVIYYRNANKNEVKARGALQRDSTAAGFDKYVMPQMDLTQENLNAHQMSYGISSVRTAIFDELGDERYSGFDPLVAATLIQRPQVDIAHDRTIHMANNDEDVLEINCAGSGFKQFRNEHLGFHGEKEDTSTTRFASVFGKVLKLGNRVINGIFKKEEESEATHKKFDRITIPGPGQLNYFSKFSMNVISDYVFKLSTEYITKIVNTPEWMANHTPININITGHSRGGVAETMGISRVMKWAQDTFGKNPATADLASFIKINMIQLDPVAGGDISLDKYDKADLRQKDDAAVPELDTTTVYSIHSDHMGGFTPMQVRGQSRIILMADRHGVGLDSIDTSQANVAGDEQFHRPSLFDSQTGKAYRDTGYSQMPKGIFFRDEFGAVVRMRSYGEAIKVMSKVLKGTHFQHRRHGVVEKAIKEWFIDNEYVDETMSDADIDQMRMRLSDSANPNSPSRIIFDENVSDSSDMKKLKKVLADTEVNRMMTPANDHSLIKVFEDGIEACKEYMRSKNPRSADGKRRMGAVSDYLSYYRAELKRLRDAGV